jgi:hypothetical protein
MRSQVKHPIRTNGPDHRANLLPVFDAPFMQTHFVFDPGHPPDLVLGTYQ